MIFNSLEFLQLFVVVLIAYFGLPLLPLKRSWEWRKLLLLFASYYFYMAWNPPLVGLLIASTVMDYIAGLRMAASDNPRHRRLWLLVSMSGNLGMLGFFKYGNFIMGNIGAVTGQQYSTLDIILPVGISFYTFQTMSYVLDIYRERKQPVRSFLDFALFVTFFPQLVAGPIIRAFDFLPQLPTARRVTPWHIQSGLSYIFGGLAKKVLLADSVGYLADQVFANPGQHSALTVLLGVYAYAFQIYFDFSAYSDMAIGLARVLGFELMKNFNLPYVAHSITDFWRRWHISLSTWLRDYLYIPLGGNRGGTLKTYRNLMLTMLLGGLWHGAAWNFVLWGGYHGLLLAGERLLGIKLEIVDGAWWRKVLRAAVTFHLVCVGWVFFRVQQFGDIGVVFTRLLRGDWLHVSSASYETAVVVFIVALAMLTHHLGRRSEVRDWFLSRSPHWQGLTYALIILAVFMRSAKVHRFIYFQF